MRPLLFLSAVLMATASPALAQVTVDLHALQALPERPAHIPAPHPAPSAVSRPSAPIANATPTPSVAATAPSATAAAPSATAAAPSATAAAPPATATKPPPLPAMPETVPNTAMINPITPPPPPGGSTPPPPPPISDKAATPAAPTSAGLRLTFAPGQTDLSPESVT